MKKLTAKIVTALTLLGVIFATITPVFLSPTSVMAIDEDDVQVNAEESPDEIPAPDDPDTESTEDPENPEDPETPETPEEAPEETLGDMESCRKQTGSLYWIVCPSSGVIAGAIDTIYSAINDLLEVAPITMDSDSPVYIVWEYARSLTNIVFIIFLLIVIYSQLTGVGINNYGVKRILPRLIIAVVLVNLSFVICQLAADVSNILGANLREFFGNIENQIIENGSVGSAIAEFSLSSLLTTLVGGGTIASILISAIGGGGSLFFVLLIVLLGAVVAVVSGLLTIAARQALIAILIMIAPLAFVAYLLPGTERWFSRWKDLLFRMLFFYPIFSLLFGASQLIGYALITSADSELGLILGLAVQIFPLFFSWSLMRMSGTILGKLNTGIRRLAAPVQRGFGAWALSHAERNRQYHLANSAQPGARLRRYLDYRRELRETDTRNSIEIRRGRAIERTMHTLTSYEGRDENGMPIYGPATHYSHNAKRASLQRTRTDTSLLAYKNVLSGYDRHFNTPTAHTLSAAHADAYKDAMAQQYLAANEAEADQKWLLDQYLDASKHLGDANHYEYNRLIRSAAGGLGYLGESSIIGQVIAGNAAIENRRRAEARIMITKFKYDKPEFRAMVFDKEHINDNGIAVDEDGNALENDQFQLLPGKNYTEWQNYIYAHKRTNSRLTRAEYDNLDNSEKANYRRVRYMDIKDIDGKPVQRVYEDDAGYMKELLGDDVSIGDPINRRYANSIGVTEAALEASGVGKPGSLRKYHSTITGALQSSGYKEHNAAFTPMLLAQAGMGYINTPGERNIAELQSLNVASKPGPILQNDAVFLKNWADMLGSLLSDNPADFSYYFPDQDIMTYRNVNGEHLKGLRLAYDAEGNPVWEELDQAALRNMSDAEVLEARKNYLKHNVLLKSTKKLIGVSNRRLSPNILENQKPDTLTALIDLANTLRALGLANLDDTVPFEKKLDGTLNPDGTIKNIFETNDPTVLQDIIASAQREIARRQAGGEDPTADPSTPRGRSRSGGPSINSDVIRQLAEQLARLAANDDLQSRATDTTEIISQLDTFIGDNFTDLNTALGYAENLLDQIPSTDPRYYEILQIIDRYRSSTPPMTTAESITRKDDFLSEIRDYLQRYGYDD